MRKWAWLAAVTVAGVLAGAPAALAYTLCYGSQCKSYTGTPPSQDTLQRNGWTLKPDSEGGGGSGSSYGASGGSASSGSGAGGASSGGSSGSSGYGGGSFGSSNSSVGVRDTLRQLGIPDSQIGYNPSTGKVSIGGIELNIGGLENRDGRTYATRDSIEIALRQVGLLGGLGGSGPSSGGGSGFGSTPQVTPTDLLAAVKRQYEEAKKQGDTALMDRLHQQANLLRQQGADEQRANEIVWGTPDGYCGVYSCNGRPPTGGSAGNQTPGQGGNAASAGASYYSSNGFAVAYAGGIKGDEIVVFDRNGNVVWQGEGDRRPDGRLIPPKEVRDRIGFGSAPAYGMGNPMFFCNSGDACQKGGGDAKGPKGNRGSKESLSPFEDFKDYAGMVPVTLTLPDGRQVTGYANVYHNEAGLGASAIPASSELGKLLQQAGFQAANGQVLIHNGAPGANVSWTPKIQPGTEKEAEGAGLWGAQLWNVGPRCQTCIGGGGIAITIGPQGGGSGGGGGGGGMVAPAIRSASVSPDPVVEGNQVTVTADIAGPVTDVTASFSWGQTVTMTNQGGVWKATATTPHQPGPASVTVSASNGPLAAWKTVPFTVLPAPAAITGVSIAPNPVKYGQELTVTVTTAGRVDRVTFQVQPRRTGLRLSDYTWTLARSGGAAPGTQTWTVTIKAGAWITHEELQTAFCQGDLSNSRWQSVCGNIQPYTATITATGPGGTATAQRQVTVQGTTIWVVPVPR